MMSQRSPVTKTGARNVDGQPSRGKRRRGEPRSRRSRLDRITTVWMLLAIAAIVHSLGFSGTLPQQWWTTVHLVTLGVLTNAILQWTWYFARSLLRLAKHDPKAGKHQAARQIVFNVALVVLIWAMWEANAVAAVGAATVIGLVVLWHVVALTLAARTNLGARFAVIIRYYVAAGVMLLVGVILGALDIVPLIAADSPEVLLDVQDDLAAAHLLINGLGFVGLTIAGTLVTLAPTALRTRMDPDAAQKATRAMPIAVTGVLGAALAAGLGQLPIAGLFVLVYLATLARGVGVGLVDAVRRKPPSEVATCNFGFGIAWFAVGVLWLAVTLLSVSDATSFRSDARLVLVALGVGGVLQILVGALSYLLPVVVGGGPAIVRQGIAVIEAGGAFRLAARNAGLVVVLLATGNSTVSLAPLIALIAATFTLDVFAWTQAAITQVRAKRTADEGPRNRDLLGKV